MPDQPALADAPPPPASPAPVAVGSGTRPPASKAFTRRALIAGVIAVAAFSVAVPINDWVLDNTLLYCHYLPPVAVLVALVFALGVNPLLGRRRFATGELTVVLAMVLALGGVASNGLAWLWVQVASGPARLLPMTADLWPLAPKDGDVALPASMLVAIPGHGPLSTDDPEYRLVIDGFYNGLPREGRIGHRAVVSWRDGAGEHRQLALSGAVRDGRDAGGFLDLDAGTGLALRGHRAGDDVVTPAGVAHVVAVDPAGIPWHAWVPVFLRWLPLIIGSIVAYVAMAGIVRRQWIDHERLPFPIAAFLAQLIEPPEPGRRLAPLYRDRGFRMAAAAAMIVLGSQGLYAWHLLPVAIPTTIDLGPVLHTDFWRGLYSWSAIARPHVYLSIVGLAFFLPLDLSFSLWFFFLATNALYLLCNNLGLPIGPQRGAAAGVGAFASECMLVLWIGRRHYLAALAAAIPGFRRGASVVEGDYVRALLLACAAMAATLVALGTTVHHAVIGVLVLLGFMLVLARLVAEAGIPFVQTPTGCFLTQVVFSITGTAAPVSVLAPVALLGAGLLSDSRENLLPYAVQVEYLAERAGVPRRRLSAVMVLTASAGAAACIAVMLLIWYRMDHVADSWPLMTLEQDNLRPLVQAATGAAGSRAETWSSYAVGAGVVAVAGIGRALFSWWPLHPLGAVIVPAAATGHIWFSFLLAWTAKLLVMRYGGMHVYRRLKPVAIGLIAGETGAALVFLIIGVVCRWFGVVLEKTPHFLPG